MGADEAVQAARRRGDAAAAGHLGDETAARRLLDDVDAGVRAAALAALVRCGAVTAGDAAQALADPDPAVRIAACELAGSLPSPDYRTLLDDDAEVVEAACFALGETCDRSAVDQLCSIARRHDDPLCRESAVAALGAIGDPDGLASVLAALDDRPQVRRRAVIALAAFDDPSVEPALRRCLEDKDWQVRQVAEDLLGITDET